MRFSSWFVPSSATLATFALFASTASAHIELIDPPPRYQLPANKSCPCGDGDSNRVCQTTAAETHDDNRSTTVTTLEAGSTITVTAEEYIDHSGRMRVAFDNDGADLADFNANILADESDPSDPTIVQAPRTWTFEIQVPNTPCENCTLQVIQDMNGNTTTPVADPAGDSTYYSCADIRIVPAGTLEAGGTGGSGGQTGAGGSAIVGTGGAAGAAGAAGGGDDEDEGYGRQHGRGWLGNGGPSGRRYEQRRGRQRRRERRGRRRGRWRLLVDQRRWSRRGRLGPGAGSCADRSRAASASPRGALNRERAFRAGPSPRAGSRLALRPELAAPDSLRGPSWSRPTRCAPRARLREAPRASRACASG